VTEARYLVPPGADWACWDDVNAVLSFMTDAEAVENARENERQLGGEFAGVAHRRRKTLLEEVAPADVVEGTMFQSPPAQGQKHTPVNDHLAEVLREPLRELIPSEGFIEVFDRFEYFFSLAYGDLTAGETVGETVWTPYGSYRWRRWNSDESFREKIADEAREAGDSPTGWVFLRGPLFGGRLDRFLEVKAAVDTHLDRLPIF
jgi:hypothetical protein